MCRYNAQAVLLADTDGIPAHLLHEPLDLNRDRENHAFYCGLFADRDHSSRLCAAG